MMLYIVVIVLMLVIVVPVYYMRMTQAYSDEVRRLEHDVEQMVSMKDELEIEVAGLAAQEDDLNRQKISLIDVDPTLPSLGGPGMKTEYKTPEDYLLSSGVITEADLDKARKFKLGSKSPYDLGEILVMMDTISSAELSMAKSKVGG